MTKFNSILQEEMSQSATSPRIPLAVSMKGRIASRAHSFKENILEALGHHSHLHHPPHEEKGIHLAKKTNSSDSLIGYSEPKHNTDGLVRDVQLSLR